MAELCDSVRENIDKLRFLIGLHDKAINLYRESYSSIYLHNRDITNCMLKLESLIIDEIRPLIKGE